MPWYDAAMRTVIDLPPEQVTGLAVFCAEKHVSRAEAVRRAVRLLLEQKETKERDFEEAMAASLGIWRGLDNDAKDYVNKGRYEWDEEEERLWLRGQPSTAIS